MKESNIYEDAIKLFCGDYIFEQINMYGHESLKLKGEIKNLTISFIQIFPMSKFSQDSNPRSIIDFLYKYYEAIFHQIHSNDGTIINVNADQIIAVWGLKKSELHVESSCNSSIECLNNFNKIKSTINNTNINLHIGISSGDIVIGNFGTKDRIFLNIMGDHVQLANNLMNYNQIYKTNNLISEYSINLLSKSFNFREIDKIRMNNFEKPLNIYELQ